MESNGGYKVPMRDHNKQSNRDNKTSQDMRRYSGVLSVFGDQQWFTMNAELSARGECGNTLAIYKRSSEDGKCKYHVTIDLNKVCGMITPGIGKSEGLHLVLLFTTDKRCHMVSALSAVERDNWARELALTIGKGHAFPVVLPTQNTYGHKDAILYYNTVKKNLLLISKPGTNIAEKCTLLAIWHMSDVKSFGSSRSKLVIQTKKCVNQGACHLCLQTPMARRIVHLMKDKCEEECSCCSKPHPFSQMASSPSDSSSRSCSSSSESDDELSVVKVELRSKSLQRLHSANDEMDIFPRNGRKTPEPSSGNKILKKRAATIDRFAAKSDAVNNKRDETILHSLLFAPHKMNKIKSESSLPRNASISQGTTTRPSLPEFENTYEEIKPKLAESKSSLYEEIPEDLIRDPQSPVASSTPNTSRNSWGGHSSSSVSHDAIERTPSRTLHSSYSEHAQDMSLYEAMNRQEQLEAMMTRQNSHPPQQMEDSYVCMHSLRNRQSLTLKPASSDGQVIKHNSSVPMYINTSSNRNSNPIAYANLTDVCDSSSTGNLAYAEISPATPKSKSSGEESASPEPTSYAEIDHNLTEALRVTSIQRRPVCRAQTLDTAKHKKIPKKWLKLYSKKA